MKGHLKKQQKNVIVILIGYNTNKAILIWHQTSLLKAPFSKGE